jgi:hypothetical protein
MTLRIIILNIMPISIMALSLRSQNIMALSKMTISIITHRITSLILSVISECLFVVAMPYGPTKASTTFAPVAGNFNNDGAETLGNLTEVEDSLQSIDVLIPKVYMYAV